MTATIISLILTLAPHFNLDPNLALAVARNESSLRPEVIGAVGEVGLFQVRPKYSYYSAKELLNPAINIVEGLRMLSEAKKRCKHREGHTWIICFNRGVTGASKVKFPKKTQYYKRVMSYYEK